MSFCFTRRTRSRPLIFTSLEVQVPGGGEQISAGCSFKARSPNPAQLSWLREAVLPDPVGLQSLHVRPRQEGAGPAQLPPLLGCSRWDGRGRSPFASRPSPEARSLLCGLWSPAHIVPQGCLAHLPPGSPTGLRPVSWIALGRRPGFTSYSCSALMTTIP